MEVTVKKMLYTEIEIPDGLNEEQIADAVKEQIKDLDLEDWDEVCYYGTEEYVVTDNYSGIDVAELSLKPGWK